jgi:peptidoglycan biosynthesis protein MviN/MurJ (putative lipid II flippase)
VAGIALASTLSAALNAFFLMKKLHLSIPEIRLGLLVKTASLTLLASGLMGLFLEGSRHLFLMEYASRLTLCFKLFSIIGIGMGVFFMCALLFRIETMKQVREKFFRVKSENRN